MIALSQNQVLQRLDNLPDNLREALFSEPNSDFLWKVSEDEHIPDEKIYEISQVAGYVFMGFLHPEDLATEIKDRLNLSPQSASAIQDALNKRVFSPLRQDLDNIYQPVSKLEVAPKMMQDIGPVASAVSQASRPIPQAPPPQAPRPISAMPSPMPKPVSPSPTPSSSLPPSFSPTTKIPSASEGKFAPFTPAPSSLPQTGWSKMMTAEPPKFGPGTPIAKTPTTTASPTPEMPASPNQPAKPAVATAGPAPVMLHEDASFKSTDKATDFHLAKPGQGAEVPLGGVKSGQTVRPAVLELGTLGNVSAQKPQPSVPKLTHYTEFKSDTPRNITEITAASPKAAPSMLTPNAVPPVQKPIAPSPSSPAPATFSSQTTPRFSSTFTQAPNLAPAQQTAPTPMPIKPAASASPMAAKVSSAIPIPQPPKPPASNMPPAPLQGKVVKQDYL